MNRRTMLRGLGATLAAAPIAVVSATKPAEAEFELPILEEVRSDTAFEDGYVAGYAEAQRTQRWGSP